MYAVLIEILCGSHSAVKKIHWTAKNLGNIYHDYAILAYVLWDVYEFDLGPKVAMNPVSRSCQVLKPTSKLKGF